MTHSAQPRVERNGCAMGNAIDSVVAAFAAFGALSDPAALAAERNTHRALEGHVYT